MTDWVLSLNGQLLRSEDALTALRQTRLGSKSTASIFLMALHYLLVTSNTAELKTLLEMYQRSPDLTEFSRKLCYRLLSNDRPDKLNVLLVDIIRYAGPAIDPSPAQLASSVPPEATNETAFPDSEDNLIDEEMSQSRTAAAEPQAQFQSINLQGNQLLIALHILRSVLLPTVDIRLRILRNHSFLLSFLFYICSNQQHPQQILEQTTKCLCDLFLIAEPTDFKSYFLIPRSGFPGAVASQQHSHGSLTSATFISAILSLVKTKFPTVLDHTIRIISYAYEYGDGNVTEALDDFPIFDEMLTQMPHNRQTLATWLQHLASHLASRIPARLHSRYLEVLLSLREVEGATIRHFVLRSILVMESIGVRLGVEVLYRESVDARRQKQIYMRRTCEGCRQTERNFGEFMMCAGCRKVRYCSKECQTRDWKYHRMQCSFFRPRAGYRSRGTQTAVDAEVQAYGGMIVAAIDQDLMNVDHIPLGSVMVESSESAPISRVHSLVHERSVVSRMHQDNTEEPLAIMEDATGIDPMRDTNDYGGQQVPGAGPDEATSTNYQLDDEEIARSQRDGDYPMLEARRSAKSEIGVQTDVSYGGDRRWNLRFERDAGTQT